MAKSKRQPPPVGLFLPWDSPWDSQAERSLGIAIETLGRDDLPSMARRQYVFCPGRAFRADFAWPQHGLIVEVNGGQYKARGGGHNRDKDRWRNAQAVALGFRVMLFSPQMIEEDPGTCVALIEQALGLSPFTPLSIEG